MIYNQRERCNLAYTSTFSLQKIFFFFHKLRRNGKVWDVNIKWMKLRKKSGNKKRCTYKCIALHWMVCLQSLRNNNHDLAQGFHLTHQASHVWKKKNNYNLCISVSMPINIIMEELTYTIITCKCHNSMQEPSLVISYKFICATPSSPCSGWQHAVESLCEWPVIYVALRHMQMSNQDI